MVCGCVRRPSPPGPAAGFSPGSSAGSCGSARRWGRRPCRWPPGTASGGRSSPRSRSGRAGGAPGTLSAGPARRGWCAPSGRGPGARRTGDRPAGTPPAGSCRPSGCRTGPAPAPTEGASPSAWGGGGRGRGRECGPAWSGRPARCSRCRSRRCGSPGRCPGPDPSPPSPGRAGSPAPR